MGRKKGDKDKPETKRVRRTKAELGKLRNEPKTKIVSARVPIKSDKAFSQKIKDFIKKLIKDLEKSNLD